MQTTIHVLQNQAKPAPAPGTRLPQILLLAGVIFLVILILVTKQMTEAAPVTAPVAVGGAPATTELPEVQLMRALDTGQPTLAFFQSLTCAACKEMTAIVNQVYPEFADSITLVDVDVYDERNEALMESAGIRAIPTVILFDRSGAAEVRLGVVKAAELRRMLNDLRGGS